MKKCLRCNSELIEGLRLSMPFKAVDIVVKQEGFLSFSATSVKAALCPKCGHLETYVELEGKTEELNKIIEGRERGEK